MIYPLGSLVVAFATFCGPSEAFPTYSNQIPNGQQVPNPGPQGGTWAGVGHLKAGGGGTLNPFGQDFANAGHEWTLALCEMDSDGDGRSNGEELGDPDCLWIVGEENPELPSLSHPGIVDEPLEKPSLDACSKYVEPETTIAYNIQFSEPTSISGSRTHYICEQIEQAVPSQEVLHQIKSSVLIDNKSILHHMFVYLCPDGSTDGDKVGQGPYECGGNESKCSRIAGWAVGPKDSCLPPNIGQEINFTGMEKVIVKVEAHYDNALGIPQQDQSGIQVTFTPELRPLKSQASVVGVGVPDSKFIIPPLTASFPLTGLCPSEATSELQHPVYVYQFAPHMHLFGRTLFTEHYRCGEKIGEIGRINAFEFDNQQNYVLDPPIKVLPGDAFVTTCEYDTLASDEAVRGGEGTSDEMCLNFLSFYPSTEDDPGLLAACVSFPDGIDVDRAAVDFDSAPQGFNPALFANLGFAITGNRDDPQKNILLQFEHDPNKSWAPCCETNTCDEALTAQQGGACAIHADCMEGLMCDGGLCSVEAPLVSPVDTANTEDLTESTSSSVVHFTLTAAILFLSVVLGF